MNAAAHKGALRSVALLGAAVFLAYGNALLWGQFQFDDYKVIVDNPDVHSWQAWQGNLAHGIRPLLKFTYTLDWTSGWGAAGFHLTNLLIHFANVLLVWALSRRFAEAQPALRAQAAAISLFAALLFAVHPLHSEAITYICGRSAALMTLFYLAATCAFLAGRRTDNRTLLHLATPACFLLALSVKETAATFPLALLALEFCCGGHWRSALRRQWSSWLLLAAGAAFFFSHENYLREMEISAGLNSLSGNLATQALAIAYLLRQWLLPLWLNIDPDLSVQRDFSAVVPQLLLLATLLAMMLMTFRRRPWVSFAIAWILIQMLPLHLFLPRLDVANDRQMYLVGGPLALMLGAELVLRLPRRTFIAIAAALLVAAGGLTVARNRDYYDEIALWQATAKLSPDKARVRNNLGYAYHLAGRNAEARSEYRRALAIDPAYSKARYNLARLDAEGL